MIQKYEKYIKTDSNQSRDNVIRALIDGDIDEFYIRYGNLAYTLWSANQFNNAKHYVDNFNILVDIEPLLTSYPFIEEKIMRLGWFEEIKHTTTHSASLVFPERTLPANPEIAHWYMTRQGARFYANTLQTKHRGLCGTSGNNCINSAWFLSNRSLSMELYREKLAKLLSYSQNTEQSKNLWSRLQRMKASEAIFRLAEKEQFLKGAGVWAAQLAQKIRTVETNIYSSVDGLQNFLQYQNVSLANIQRLLPPNGLLLAYLQSLENRNCVSWQISRKNVNLSLTAGTTQWIKQKIRNFVGKMQQNQSALAVKAELKELARALIGDVALPTPGGTIYVVLDEDMAGLPFELLPMPSGELLGSAYTIKYIPSLSIAAYTRANFKPGIAAIPYLVP